jgi:hypothetical protein
MAIRYYFRAFNYLLFIIPPALPPRKGTALHSL